jgi:hypothetical protein
VDWSFCTSSPVSSGFFVVSAAVPSTAHTRPTPRQVAVGRRASPPWWP